MLTDVGSLADPTHPRMQFQPLGSELGFVDLQHHGGHRLSNIGIKDKIKGKHMLYRRQKGISHLHPPTHPTSRPPFQESSFCAFRWLAVGETKSHTDLSQLALLPTDCPIITPYCYHTIIIAVILKAKLQIHSLNSCQELKPLSSFYCYLWVNDWTLSSHN